MRGQTYDFRIGVGRDSIQQPGRRAGLGNLPYLVQQPRADRDPFSHTLRRVVPLRIARHQDRLGRINGVLRCERVATEGLTNVTGLHEMDASDLKFPDASFDTVVAMYVMTVVPDPEKVMRELSRVCRPGGEVIIVNHFSAEEGKPGWEGMRGWVERRMAPFADKLGWRPVFDIERVLVCEDLTLVEKRGLRPWGLFTMMRFHKAEEAKAAA